MSKSTQEKLYKIEVKDNYRNLVEWFRAMDETDALNQCREYIENSQIRYPDPQDLELRVMGSYK